MSDGTKTTIKTMGFCGPCSASEPAEVDVNGGRIVRIRPFGYQANAGEDPLARWSIKARGGEFKAAEKSEITPFALATKHRVYSPNRILYPMKRVDWDPNGERNPQNRGTSKYVRISWDGATQLIADEIQRVHAQYGVNSIFVQSDGHHQVKTLHGPRGCEGALLDILGGYCLQARNPDSWEGWYWGAKHIWGCDPVGEGDQQNLFYDVAQNSDTVLFWGCDVVTTPWGWGGHFPSRYCFFLRDIGVRQIYICPDVNYGAAVHADKWIPVLPNTDSALQLAIAHTWLKEGTYDRAYIETHATGFDWFEYHVMGGDDGIEKTPEWAEGICGVPARIIKALARSWAKQNVSIAHCNGGSFIRSTYSHEPARLEVALLGMQALGHPGRNQLKMMEYQLFSLPQQTPIPRSKFIPNLFSVLLPYAADTRDSLVPETLVPEALAGDYSHENPLTWYGCTVAGVPVEDQFRPLQYPAEGSERIHMVWIDSPKWTSSWNGGYKFIEALHSDLIECVVAQHIWMEDDCLLADIILPVNTKFEERDINCDIMSGNYNTLVLEEQSVEPLGESKSDWECAVAVAEKLGVAAELVGGKSLDDKMRIGFENSGVQDYMTYEEFLEKKSFIVPPAEGWEKDPAGFFGFYSDPKAHPLTTPSGLLEYYSPRLAEKFPDDTERMPYPRWIEKGETHPDERLSTERAKAYPYLLVSNHPHWRLHSQLDDCAWFREIKTCKVVGPDGYAYEPVWINPVDARELGVVSGDIVKIFNDRGWTMGGVYVTERVRPRAVLQDHGARMDPIVLGESDRGGTNNLIAPKAIASKNCAGEVTSGYLVGIEKVDVFELARQYPEAFSRPYDPETGPLHIVDALREECEGAVR
ncbi:MAG: molybdopterin-dependent oxidoreductase [Coriobacteriia bacterium]